MEAHVLDTIAIKRKSWMLRSDNSIEFNPLANLFTNALSMLSLLYVVSFASYLFCKVFILHTGL